MKRDFDAEAAALPKHRFDELMHGYMLRTFRPHLDGVSALELGCFEAAMTRRLRDIYPDLTVVDASIDCIAEALAIGRQIECLHNTFESVELDRKYDAIFALHVLEHLDCPVTVLKRCREWLAPGGRIFVAVPNAHAASRQIAVEMGLLPEATAVMPAEAKHGHQRTYSQFTLRQHIAMAGLRVIEDGGIFFKALSGAQFDIAIAERVVDDRYLEGCYGLGKQYPDLCASLYAVCTA